MALALTGHAGAGGFGGRTTTTGLSATQRLVAVGVSSSAPRHLASGNRWIGGEAAEIDTRLIGKCSEGAEWGKIVDLNFHFKFIGKIEGLDEFAANLRNLDLSSNNIREIEGLEGMSKLKELKLHSCQITRIQGLKVCPALAALHLEDNHITTIDGLDTLKFLEYLALSKNMIQKLGRSLSKLAKLRELHLAHNQLQSLDGVAGLSNLEVLSANNNQIQELSADNFKGLGKLDELRLSNNELLNFTFLAASGTTGSSLPPLPCLGILDMSCNALTSQALARMPPLPQLVELNLSGNHIEQLTGVVTSCRALEILDLSRNRIEEVEHIGALKDLFSLQELLLEGNAVLREEKLQSALAGLSVEYLDDQPLPKAPAPQQASESLMLVEDIEDTDTFPLTTTKALGETAASFASAKGSAQGASRPSTSASRPGTAQSMKEAGVKNPVMHVRLKVSERRFATEEQAAQWEKQTLSGLAAIESQVARTMKQADAELKDMERFLEKAQKMFKKREELKAQGVKGLDATLVSLAEDEEAEEAAAAAASPEPPSRAAQRLRSAVGDSRGSTPSVEEDSSPVRPRPVGLESEPPAGVAGLRTPPGRTPPNRGPLLAAAFDEEIEDIVDDSGDVSLADGASEEEKSEAAPEVDVEELPRASSLGPPKTGPAVAEGGRDFRLEKRASSRDARAGSRDARADSRDARAAGRAAGAAAATGGTRRVRRAGSGSRGPPPLGAAARVR